MYFDESKAAVLKKLKTKIKLGLSTSEVSKRYDKYGANELEHKGGVSPIKIFLEQFNSPLVWILVVALVISISLKEELDAIVIGTIIILNAILGFYQEYRAERSIEALQKLASLKAKVIRNGKEKEVDSKNLVPGDIIVLETGDKIPADARLIEVHELKTQEGPLTGESLPVSKSDKVLGKKTVLAERKNMIYAGTVVSAGRAKAVIVETGMSSQIGKIATLIQEAHEQYTPLQKKLRELGKYLTVAVLVVAAVVFGVGLLTGEAASVMLLTAIALAVAAIPEGLPAVITVSLALGVQKMIKRNVLVRKLPSVETLGSVSVICTDKTGTLTHNQMTVTKLWASNMLYEVSGAGYSKEGNFRIGNKVANPEPLYQLLKIGAMCNDAILGEEKINGHKQRELLGDPTEAALLVSAEKAGFSRDELTKRSPRVNEIPFTSERKLMTTIHKVAALKRNKRLLSFSKGAPDVVIDKCDRILINGKIQRITKEWKKQILKQNEDYAKQALRVLGFAYNDNFVNKTQSEDNMIFVGLQAMMDPPRQEVKDSINSVKVLELK